MVRSGAADRTGRSPLPPVVVGGLLLVGLAVAHVAGTALAYNVNRVTSDGVPLFPAAGATLAALVLVPRRFWAVVLLATFGSELIADLVIDETVGTAIGSALSNTVEPLLGAVLVQRWVPGVPQLDRRVPLGGYLLGGVVLGPALGAVVGATATRFTPGHSSFFGVLGRWFTGDALGVLVVGSLIVAWVGFDRRHHRDLGNRIEAAGAAVSLVLVTGLAFWGNAPALAYATLPVLGWAALRFGVRGATAGGATVAVMADWATIEDHGLFARIAGVEHQQALWQLQLFLAVLILTALLLASQVTELAESERALQVTEEQRKFRLLLEASPDATVIVDAQGRIEYANPQFQSLQPPDHGELLGSDVLDLLPEDQRENAGALIREVIGAPPGTRRSVELARVGPNSNRTFDTALSPLDSAEGRSLIATLRDVTARTDAESALRDALAAAEQATRAKSEFLATMSHEIRTPMNGVIGMVDILGRSSLGADQRQIVTTIADSAHTLLSVIDDILDFSKIEAGKLTIEAEPFDLRDVVDGVGEILASGAARNGVELSCATSDDVPETVVGDPVRLRQLLFNLAGNAIKFTAQGSVRVRVDARPGGVRLSVVDTGIGISEEQQRSLFEPFVQGEQSTTRRYGGSGLGLAIVARLVELMGGAVDVVSAPGAGSTFSVDLPLPSRPGTAPQALPLAGLRVIVVLADGVTSPADGLALAALRRAGAEAVPCTVADARTGAQDGDVLYVTRSALSVAGPALQVELEGYAAGPVVADRSAEGATTLSGATSVSTTALTARSLVRTVAIATGRISGEDTLAGALAARAITAGGPVVLVAEDHPTNQVILRRQLTMLGFACHVANDGLEALELLSELPIDLLLADCHMPRLDGYELTRRIRADEEGTGRRLPILAITASALPSEAERCLEAGMDLVLTKPVSIEGLDQALARYLPDTATLVPLPDLAPHDPVIDLSVLRKLVGDVPEAVSQITTTFHRNSTELLEQLDTAALNADEELMHSVAHRLLGGARTMGAHRLTEVCEEIDARGDTPALALANRLRAELITVLAAVAPGMAVSADG